MSNQGPDPQRLDQLDKHIDEVRDRVDEQEGEGGERRFIEGGDQGGPVDDTIAPPG